MLESGQNKRKTLHAQIKATSLPQAACKKIKKIAQASEDRALMGTDQ
jgi:hypothetical protein